MMDARGVRRDQMGTRRSTSSCPPPSFAGAENQMPDANLRFVEMNGIEPSAS
jgi:hypothetical protein